MAEHWNGLLEPIAAQVASEVAAGDDVVRDAFAMSIAISLKRIADKLDAIPISSDFGHDLRVALHNAGQDFAAGMRGRG